MLDGSAYAKGRSQQMVAMFIAASLEGRAVTAMLSRRAGRDGPSYHKKSGGEPIEGASVTFVEDLA